MAVATARTSAQSAVPWTKGSCYPLTVSAARSSAASRTDRPTSPTHRHQQASQIAPMPRATKANPSQDHNLCRTSQWPAIPMRLVLPCATYPCLVWGLVPFVRWQIKHSDHSLDRNDMRVGRAQRISCQSFCRSDQVFCGYDLIHQTPSKTFARRHLLPSHQD